MQQRDIQINNSKSFTVARQQQQQVKDKVKKRRSSRSKSKNMSKSAYNLDEMVQAVSRGIRETLGK